MEGKFTKEHPEKESNERNSIWIDRKNKVISFTAVDGFEKLEFSTHSEMFAFAIAKGSEDFGIQ